MDSVSSLTRKFRTLTGLISRTLAGRSHNDERDVYKVAGYKMELQLDDYEQLYGREDIASRIIDAPPEETWRVEPRVFEDQDPTTETPFELAWNSLRERLRLFHYFQRVDKMAGVGHYAVLFIGVNDGADLESPITGVSGPDAVLYLQALRESHATVATYETDRTNSRFDHPLYYDLNFSAARSTSGGGRKQRVHWSRVVHVAEGLTDNEVFGEPRLLKVYNRIKDLQKLVAGGAEIWWNNARGGLQADVGDEASMGDLQGGDEGEGDYERLEQEMNEYFHGVRRVIRTRNVKLTPLNMTMADPEPMFKVIIALISAKSGIPKRVLVGSERGELASTQDERNWGKKIISRQEAYAEPMILRAFIDRLIQWKALPAPAEGQQYTVEWPDLLAPSRKDQAEVFTEQMKGLREYGNAMDKDPNIVLVIDPSEVREALGRAPREKQEVDDLLALYGVEPEIIADDEPLGIAAVS